MVSPFLRLPVALEAVVEVVQQLGDLGMADGMSALSQFFRNRPRTLTNPSQRRFRVAPCLVFDQAFQGGHQPRVAHREGFAAGWQHGTRVDFPNAFGDHVARQSARPPDQTHSPITPRDRFTGRHEAPRTFVQQRPHRLELRRQLGNTVHAQAA